MANPQCENGFTKIANDTQDAFARIRIPGEARQVLDFVLRKVYGWNKKSDRISLSQFVLGTGLRKPKIIQAIRKLEAMNLISHKGNASVDKVGNLYTFNKDFDTWKPLPKKGTLPIKETISLPIKVKDVLPIKGPTKAYYNTKTRKNTKESIKRIPCEKQKPVDKLKTKKGAYPEVKQAIDHYFVFYIDPKIGGYKVKPTMQYDQVKGERRLGGKEGKLLRGVVDRLKQDEVWDYCSKPFIEIMDMILTAYLLDKNKFLVERRHDIAYFCSTFNTWWLPIKEMLWAQSKPKRDSVKIKGEPVGIGGLVAAVMPK